MLFYFITFSLRCQHFYRIFTKCRLALRKHGVLCPRSPRFRASCRFTTLPYYYIRAFRFRQRISSPHTVRYTRQPTPEAAARRITAFDKGETVLLCVCPIVVQGDVEGGVLLTGRPQDAAPDAETARAVNIAAAFLAKWMEE